MAGLYVHGSSISLQGMLIICWLDQEEKSCLAFLAGSVHIPLGSCGQSGGDQKNAICLSLKAGLDVTVAEPLDFHANFHWWCCPVG